MGRRHRFRDNERQLHVGGFTLLEVIVALSILGVAITIFVSLFYNSLVLGTASRSELVSASLAEERLADIQANPTAYDWSDVASRTPGQLGRVAGNSRGFVVPSTMPEDARNAQRETDFFRKFTWEAYAMKPEAEAAYLEVTVVVRWQESGRQRRFCLTSVLPQARLEDAA
ncbi:MAG: prepilin-type N-terminal cleavage/methylation domain-containing protein [bacterium]|nr:prepilin-type N-terminal cleavage/methylation domain-containing protein [bacterium]